MNSFLPGQSAGTGPRPQDLRDSKSNQKERKMLFYSLFLLIFVIKYVFIHGFKTKIVIKMGINSHMKSILASITSGLVVNGMTMNGANAIDVNNKNMPEILVRIS